MIRALVFDFDGLILDTETPIIDAWMRVHAEAGVACTREQALQIVGHVDTIWDPWAAFPAHHDRATLTQAHRNFVRELVAGQPILPGVKALLDAAHARGLGLGLASNSSHAHVDGHLARLELLTCFDVIRCRDDVAVGKPAPDVYLATLKMLGVAPHEAIAFEDSVPGHIAARRAGLHCVVIPGASTIHCEFPEAHLQLRSLADATLDDLCTRFDRTG